MADHRKGTNVGDEQGEMEKSSVTRNLEPAALEQEYEKGSPMKLPVLDSGVRRARNMKVERAELRRGKWWYQVKRSGWGNEEALYRDENGNDWFPEDLLEWAGGTLADEKLEDGLSSPTTAYTDDVGESPLHSCGAVKGGSASEQRWCGPLALLSHLSRACSSSGTWRARLRIKEPECLPDIEETKTRQLEHCPKGYPRLAAFLSSEHSFSIYRGFGYLHSRVILSLQDQIVSLERELDQKDSFDQENGLTLRLQSRARDERESRRNGEERPRERILEDIRRKLIEYDEILVKTRDLASFQKASERDHKSVSNWIWNLKPLVDKERCFIKHKEDLLTLHNGREWSGFDGIIESMLLKLDCKLIRRVFLTPEMRVKTTDQNVHYYARSRIDVFVSLIITSIIFILLVLPVVVMYTLTTFDAGSRSTFKAIGVLVVFTLLFSAAMSLLTKARRHELFAASAAYCAVLVVFISNFSAAE